MMHQPFTRESFIGDGAAPLARTGPQRRDRERKLMTRKCAALAEATLFTTIPRCLRRARSIPSAASRSKTRLSRYGGDCYMYCMLAAGHIDLVIESGLNAYDIVALIPIVEGAGGVITSWDGGSASRGGSVVAAGDPRAHAQALKLLAGA